MYKVFIVDDEPTVIYGLCKQVDWESLNMELAGTAANGQDALAQAAGMPIHLLITDICMPQMDGLTLLTKMKQLHPSLHCIVISAHGEFEYVKKALQLGVENYLLKPIDQGELTETLAQTVANLEKNRLVLPDRSMDMLAFRTNILERWVNGTIQEYDLQERAELLNINLSAEEYLVCVTEIQHTGNLDQQLKDASTFLELCRNTLAPDYDGEFFLDSSFHAVSILSGNAHSQSVPQIDALFRNITRQAEQRGLKVFTTISPVAAGSSKVAVSFAACVFHMEYPLLYPAALLYNCNSHNPTAHPAAEEDPGLLTRFTKTLKEENISQALILADQFLQKPTGRSIQEMKAVCLPLALTLIHSVTEEGRASEALPEGYLAQLSLFASVQTPAQLKEWLAAAIRIAMQSIRDRKKALHPLVRVSLEQIGKKYSEDLSLKTLAAVFNVSPAYLGQLFKTETGKLFNDALTEVRLQAARALLLDTDLKIGEIIIRIGIPNQSYFNRVFKKTYGISPLEFRRSIYSSAPGQHP